MNINFKSPSLAQASKQAKNMSFKGMVYVRLGRDKNSITPDQFEKKIHDEKLLPEGAEISWAPDAPDYIGLIYDGKEGNDQEDINFANKLNELYERKDQVFSAPHCNLNSMENNDKLFGTSDPISKRKYQILHELTGNPFYEDMY